MPKGKQRAEIYLLLNIGLKPKDIIKMGYTYNMVYAYNKRFLIAKELLPKLLGERAVAQTEKD